MEIFTLPRLRVAELQALTEVTIKICENIEGIDPALNKVTSGYDKYKESMLKVAASADDKKDLDKTRDRLISGFIKDVQAEKLFPHEDAAIKKSVKELVNIAGKYGTKINRYPLNEQTAAVDNLLTECKALNLSSLDGSGIARWLPLIENANAGFKQANQQYIEDSAGSSAIDPATSLAPELTDAIGNLIIVLYTKARFSNDEAAGKALAELEELVDSYR